jgi:hypothetical protein
LSPDDILKEKINFIPPFVIEAVNRLLGQRFSGSSCVLLQKEVIALAEKIGVEYRELPEGGNRQMFFERHWLDFEPVYRELGWRVEYDKPAYNETYEPSWTFSRSAK